MVVIKKILLLLFVLFVHNLNAQYADSIRYLCHNIDYDSDNIHTSSDNCNTDSYTHNHLKCLSDDDNEDCLISNNACHNPDPDAKNVI